MSKYEFDKRKPQPKRDPKKTSMSKTTLIILLTIEKEGLWSYVISKSIKLKTGIDIPVQTIYTTLKKCKKLNWVNSYTELIDGKTKTLYKTSNEGLEACHWKEEQLVNILNAIKKIKK